MQSVKNEIDHKNHAMQAGVGAFKGLLSTIPIIGPVVIGALDGYSNSRLQEFINKLSMEVIKLGEEKIDKQYIESEEFVDLFGAALRSRLQSRSEEKAKFILGMLVESIQKKRNENFHTSEKESFLFLLERLTKGEMDFYFSFLKARIVKSQKMTSIKWTIIWALLLMDSCRKVFYVKMIHGSNT